MAQIRSDTLIRSLRRRRGITQEQLAEGICARDTLSRIESGARAPSWHVFKSLMQRLGENPYKYYNTVIIAEEKRALELREEITRLIKDDQFAEAGKLLDEAEKDVAFNTDGNRQFIMRNRAMIVEAVERDSRRGFAMLEEALKITIPDFSENEVDTYLLTYDEIAAINSIAVFYSHMDGEMAHAVELLLRLKTSLDDSYFDETEKVRSYCMVMYNLSTFMGLTERYRESVELCEQGLAFCKKHREGYYPPLLLYNMACVLLYLHEDEKGMEAYRRSCILFYGAGEIDELKFNRKSFNTRFKIDIGEITIKF